MEYALLEPTGFFDELIAKARVRRIRFHPRGTAARPSYLRGTCQREW
jgi:hypothetical protein